MPTTDPRPWGPSPHGSDTAVMMRYDAGKRSALAAYLLWFFLGYFGVHRFYLGRFVSGVAQAVVTLVSMPLTFLLVGYVGLAAVGLWWLLDALLIPGMARGHNERLIARLTAGGR